MIGLGVIVGEAIALGRIPPLFVSLAGFLTAFLMMAGTMVLNDIYDLDVDRLNSPRRPLLSGTIRLGQAKSLSVVLSFLSLVFAGLLGIWTTLTALLALVLMVYYNTGGKRTGLPGNMVVSFNVALPFFYGGIAVGSIRPILFIFSLLAFLANLGREIAKSIPDLQGDRELGIKTLAVSRGPKFAARTSAILLLLSAALSVLPLLPLGFGGVSVLYIPGVALADLGFVYSASRLFRSQNPESVRKIKNQVLLWMLFGLVGFLVGGTVSF